MTDTKWTPGPWERDRHGQRRGANGQTVNVWDAGIGWSSRSDETESNANLIAAAPDLYEALRNSRIWVEANVAPVRQLSPQAAKPGEEMLQRIDAALAKARGEA